jgi:hypothetical protein
MGSVKKDITDIKSEIAAKEETQNSKNGKHRSPTVLGMIGLLNEELARKKEHSSFGVKYECVLDRNICEVNEAFSKWDRIGCIPSLGRFIEVENTGNNLKTWCMVIGSFNDTGNPNRILLVSGEVSDSLLFRRRRGILSAKIRLLNEAEWRANKDCFDLYKLVSTFEES